MSNGMGDLPDALFGPSRYKNDNLYGIDNVADMLIANNNQRGHGQHISQISAIDNLLYQYKHDKNNPKKSEVTIPIKVVPKKKEEKPRIDPHTIALELFGAYKQNKKANEDFENMLRNRQILPVAQQIAEFILKGMAWNLLKIEVFKKFPIQEVLRDAVLYLKSLPETDLLLSGLAAYPIVYGSSGCKKCREFVRNNHIQIRYVVPIILNPTPKPWNSD
jgi:hypothetical protein